VHLVGFIIRIHHNAWSSECQIYEYFWSQSAVLLLQQAVYVFISGLSTPNVGLTVGWLNNNSDYYKSWMTTVCFLAGAFFSHPLPNRLQSQIPSLWNSEGKSRAGANEADHSSQFIAEITSECGLHSPLYVFMVECLINQSITVTTLPSVAQ